MSSKGPGQFHDLKFNHQEFSEKCKNAINGYLYSEKGLQPIFFSL